jgi:hypothetical protein
LPGRVKQGEFLDFLMGGEQVAFDALGNEFQAFQVGTLLLAAQAAGDPARASGRPQRWAFMLSYSAMRPCCRPWMRCLSGCPRMPSGRAC